MAHTGGEKSKTSLALHIPKLFQKCYLPNLSTLPGPIPPRPNTTPTLLPARCPSSRPWCLGS